jgi:hypothetical protein
VKESWRYPAGLLDLGPQPLSIRCMTLLARVIARPIDDTRCTLQIDPWVAQHGSGPYGRAG